MALTAVDRLGTTPADYHACHACHATRADLLRRLGRGQQSREAYNRAIELAGNTAETASLTRRRDRLRAGLPPVGDRAGPCIPTVTTRAPRRHRPDEHSVTDAGRRLAVRQEPGGRRPRRPDAPSG
ncbi:hypothetical protein GCM10010495_65740 [Kitasatospora herbaricolor]|uniref:hypothetical protein n=1 Tax=Kitasatospora herbaricolor TaxID=68217 RepID=UPI0019A1CE91|nr:hypothetical protein [Kitasatospora herbaricolor]MDQ0313400.1 hypothetical protein [Kitasatospora herbaricolor]GGV39245.1 hypothetical protein GCM10010495_65740 [Kitasatospora herbaricolor]